MIRSAVLGFTLVLLALAAPAQAGIQEASERIFEELILKRISAFAMGDADVYVALLTDDFVHISDSGVRRTHAEMDAFVKANGGTGIPISYRVEALHWQRIGDYVMVDCVVVEQTPVGDGRFHESNLFRTSGGRWLFMHHQETPIVEIPKAIPVDPAKLRDYEGQYDYGNGLMDTVSLQNDALYVSDGTEPSPLVPIAPDTFAVSGAGGVLMFVRDGTGKVVGEVYVPINGGVITSSKLPPGPAGK